MNKYITLILLLVSSSTFAIENDTAYYHHYQSLDNNSDFIYVDIKNRIYGYCTINDEFIPFTGLLTKNNFVLRRRWSEDIIFNGTLYDAYISGQLYTAKSTDNITFYKKPQHYVLPLHQYSMLEKTKLLENKKDSPSGKLSITLILPDKKYKYYNQITSDIFELILQTEPMKDLTVDGLFEVVKKTFKESYIKQNKSRYENNHNYKKACNWIKQKTVDVIYNDENILCMSINNYAFTGGNHGITISNFINIDIETGKKIKYNDIFCKEKESSISKLIQQEIRKKYRIEDSQPLSQQGFFYDTIKPATNIYFTALGVGFVYNVYQIAPYSYGTIEVFLPIACIRESMNKEILKKYNL